MDTFLWILAGIVALGLLYLYVPYARRRRWLAELQEPATKGDARRLAGEISDVSSNVSGIRDELDKLRTAVSDVSYVSEISVNVEGVREELAGMREELDCIWEEFDGIHSDLKTMRRLLKAIAHHQWTPEWTSE
jgi:hypothetical protein